MLSRVNSYIPFLPTRLPHFPLRFCQASFRLEVFGGAARQISPKPKIMRMTANVMALRISLLPLSTAVSGCGPYQCDLHSTSISPQPASRPFCLLRVFDRAGALPQTWVGTPLAGDPGTYSQHCLTAVRRAG